MYGVALYAKSGSDIMTSFVPSKEMVVSSGSHKVIQSFGTDDITHMSLLGFGLLFQRKQGTSHLTLLNAWLLMGINIQELLIKNVVDTSFPAESKKKKKKNSTYHGTVCVLHMLIIWSYMPGKKYMKRWYHRLKSIKKKNKVGYFLFLAKLLWLHKVAVNNLRTI